MRKLSIAVAIALAGLVAWLVFRPVPKVVRDGQGQGAAEPVRLPAITGELVQPELAGRRPLAVMVENHPDSRPQSGLLEADVVYETLAEGGITRFLVLYQSREASRIGPVRSAREYFAEIANGWGAIYAHVGGSNEVIAKLKAGDYPSLSDANEYYNEQFFSRDQAKAPPHNVFTSTERLSALAKACLYKTVWSQEPPWPRKNGQPAGASSSSPSVRNVAMSFSRPGYEVSYRYDPEGNGYLRSLGGEPHRDARTGAQLEPKVVVVQVVPIVPVPDDPLLKVTVELSGEGRAVIFQDGQVLDGTWRQDKTQGPVRFYDQAGGEVRLNRGQTWVHLLPKDRAYTLVWD